MIWSRRATSIHAQLMNSDQESQFAEEIDRRELRGSLSAILFPLLPALIRVSKVWLAHLIVFLSV